MGVIRTVKKVCIAGAESGSEGNTTNPTTDDEGAATPVPPPAAASRPPPPGSSALSPALVRRRLAAALHAKQGGRTKQRMENERQLMAMYGVDSEEALLGGDIYRENKSYFGDLLTLDNQEVLHNFINNEENQFLEKSDSRRARFSPTEETFRPDEAFLNIGFNLRAALKKHLPLGILQGMESEIMEHFIENPGRSFVAGGLSSYERLLVHALCAYNYLQSHSFDSEEGRKIRVENPHKGFFVRDPSLYEYLKRRRNGHC